MAWATDLIKVSLPNQDRFFTFPPTKFTVQSFLNKTEILNLALWQEERNTKIGCTLCKCIETPTTLNLIHKLRAHTFERETARFFHGTSKSFNFNIKSP